MWLAYTVILHDDDSNSLDVLHKLRIEIGESGELRLVQIHHEQFIGWR